MPPGVSDIRRFGEGGGWSEFGDASDGSGSIGDSFEEFEGDGR